MKPPLEIIPFADMLEPDLDTRSLVKGLIDTETVVMIFGESGCGKTFWTLDLGLHIAAGLEFFGHCVTRGRVIYIAAEAGRSIKKRIAAWAEAQQLGDQQDVNFSAIVSPVDLCHLDEKGDDVDRLAAAVEAADLVIVDTVSRALAGGNENAPDDMGAFVTALDRLREKLKCTIIAVHHVGKDASLGGRGHSLLHCAVDTEIKIERHANGVCTAAVTKQRDGPGGTKLAFTLRPIELGEDQDGDPVTSCVVETADHVPPPKAKKLAPQDQKTLDALNEALAERGEIIATDGGDLKAVSVASWYEFMEKCGLFGNTAYPRQVKSRARRKLAEGDDPYVRFKWAPEDKPDDAKSFVWPARTGMPL